MKRTNTTERDSSSYYSGLVFWKVEINNVRYFVQMHTVLYYPNFVGR